MTMEVIMPDAVQRLTRDVMRAMSSDDVREINYIVKRFYRIQKTRIALWNQVLALGKQNQPNSLLFWLYMQFETLEREVKRYIERAIEVVPAARWAMSIYGIGPIIAAGLATYIDPARACKVSSIWRFAGLDPTCTWGKGEKCPWNQEFKVLCWKIGETFVKFSGRDECYYGHLYRKRKEYEWRRNVAGELRDQALARVEHVGKNTEAYKWYSGKYKGVDFSSGKPVPIPAEDGEEGLPMLPPAHIDNRARRWTVKLFLAHFCWVLWETTTGEPMPDPYAVAHLGHVEVIPPPNYKPLSPKYHSRKYVDMPHYMKTEPLI